MKYCVFSLLCAVFGSGRGQKRCDDFARAEAEICASAELSRKTLTS